jgi:sulfatase modifying factor 1
LRTHKKVYFMINRCLQLIAVTVFVFSFQSCKLGGNSKTVGLMPNDGQLRGIAPGKEWIMPRPFGMVYVPSGTFIMGAGEEDPNHNQTASNKQVTISGFWMDATEITNNEYRQFTTWVRDSVLANKVGTVKSGTKPEIKLLIKDSITKLNNVNWKEMGKINWSTPELTKILNEKELLISDINPTDERSKIQFGLDPRKMLFKSAVYDYQAAALNRDPKVPLSKFYKIDSIDIYPDTVCWIRDYAYAYNDPMAKRYFSHPVFGNYPVVGVNWRQANAFCEWRSHFMNSYFATKNKPKEAEFRLPSEAQWEYAARGGRDESPYPWGGPYLRNRKGCLLANFKPGRGDYKEDGGTYTVRVDAYWPNDFGLYCMAGNVAEWTSSFYHEGAYNLSHDLNPDIRYNYEKDGKDKGKPRMARKCVRGGSWKDVGNYLRCGARSFEHQDSAKSYVGFRCVLDLPASTVRKSRR